jgi:hypothetical protein
MGLHLLSKQEVLASPHPELALVMDIEGKKSPHTLHVHEPNGVDNAQQKQMHSWDTRSHTTITHNMID